VGARIPCENFDTERAEQRGDPRVNALCIVHGEEAATDAGLIRHHDERMPVLLKPDQAVGHSFLEGDQLNIPEVMSFDDQRAVAIQEHRRHPARIHAHASTRGAKPRTAFTTSITVMDCSPLMR
jgi:hypothetical protein